METTLNPADVMTPSPRVARWRRERAFYLTLPIGMAVTIFVGFAPTYYLRGAFGGAALARLYQVHGLLWQAFARWLIS
jgi:hypothetical protein